MKRPLTVYLSSALALVLAACATSSQTAKKSGGETEYVATAAGNTPLPDPQEEVICEYERTVGSMIPERKCRAKTDLERTREESQDLMRRTRPAPSKPE